MFKSIALPIGGKPDRVVPDAVYAGELARIASVEAARVQTAHAARVAEEEAHAAVLATAIASTTLAAESAVAVHLDVVSEESAPPMPSGGKRKRKR